ncbi:MAG: GspH/FimT family pseudopilin [Janthinobacterium lividum]
MRDRNKGFSLIELMVTVAVLAILVSVGIPTFSTLIRNNRADADTNEFYRALNYARLEAINRGVNVRVVPATTGAGWNTPLNVQIGATVTSSNPALRMIGAMSTNATMTPSSNLSYIEFNNLGGLANPTAALTMAYANGATTRNVGVCLNGRVVLNGTC